MNWKGGIDALEGICDNCGGDFEYKQSDPNRFCSLECYHDYCVGENHHAWEGGEVSYNGRWKQQRRKALKRDQARCVLCRMTDAEHHDQYDRSIDVHHIRPYRQFDDPLRANELSNLLTVCRSCHRECERIAPLRPDTSNASAD